MHATVCPGANSSKGGIRFEHSFVAIGQRVENTHPAGGFSGDGISPSNIVL